jgi:uncharacterized membrane protein
MKTLRWIGLLGLLLLGAPLFAAVSAVRTGDAIVMKNDALAITIDLTKGAGISKYDYAPFGGNITDITFGGLLYDHVWEQIWPGEFLSRKYEAEIVKNGPDEAVVKVWTIGQGDSIKDVLLERTMRLRDGDRALRCTVALTNRAAVGRVTGYWNQSVFWFQGTREGITWHQPTARGVAHDGWFVDDFTSGWIGTTSSRVPGGLIFLMDYNDLYRLYPNAISVTTEWMYDKVAIPSGKQWTTDFAVIPVYGITGFTYGSKRVVANLTVTQVPGALLLEHQLTKGLAPLKNVTVHTRVWGLRQDWTATVPDATLPELTEKVQTLKVRADGVKNMPAGIEVTVTGTDADGKAVTERYGDYFGGDYGRNIEMRDMKPILVFDRPAKQKVFLKPDKIEYKANLTPKVLFFRGLFNRQFGVDAAVKAAFPGVTIKDAWLDQSPVGQLYTYFPADYPELLSYDLIILGNAPVRPMDLVGQEMLKDYLAAGGNLLVLGGDQAYGQGGYMNATLINQLPVVLGGKYNWAKIPDGGVLQVAAAHPVTKGVTFGPRDMVYYRQLCVPKPGSVVAATAGGTPILVLGTVPSGGRLACVLATPFGEARPGECAFWDAPAWHTLMQQTARWLIMH